MWQSLRREECEAGFWQSRVVRGSSENFRRYREVCDGSRLDSEAENDEM